MNQSMVIGRAFALGAAIFFGVNTTLSRLAYDTGTTPVSLTAYRFLMSAALMLLLLALLGKPWKLRVAPWLFAVCAGGSLATSIGHLGAVRYIPVSLAAIIFYTFPLIVVAYKRCAERQPVARNEWLAFALAFAGIAIALGPEFERLDPAGILLACGGALGAAVFILSYERFPPQTDSYAATLWIMLASAAGTGLVMLSGFELAPPGTAGGWLYIALIALASVAAFVLSLRAIRSIGGATFALFLNFEPVIIFLLAWAVLGESLTAGRLAGIGLIVLALFLSHWRVPRTRSKPLRAER